MPRHRGRVAVLPRSCGAVRLAERAGDMAGAGPRRPGGSVHWLRRSRSMAVGFQIRPREGRQAPTHVGCAAARLRRPDVAREAAADDAAGFLRSGHTKQRGLLQLDLAEAHLQSGDADEAFRIAGQALELGRRVRSGRIIDRARRFRRHFHGSHTAPIVRDFDDQIHGVHF